MGPVLTERNRKAEETTQKLLQEAKPRNPKPGRCGDGNTNAEAYDLLLPGNPPPVQPRHSLQ